MSQTLSLSNVEFLQYSENMNYLNTAGFRLDAIRDMTIKGNIINLQNYQGTQGVMAGIAALRSSLEVYYPEININGQNFGQGKMISLNTTSDDNYVHTAQYTCKIQTTLRYPELTQENFGIATNNEYAGLSYLFGELLPARYIRSMKEEYIYERQDNTFSYTHSISVSTFQIVDGLQRVQSFAQQLFALTNPISSITTPAQQLDNINYKPIYNEKFDLLNNNFTFVKKLHATNPDFTNNLSVNQTENMTISENGITTVTENGTVKSLTYSQPNLVNITGGTLARLTGLFSAYNNESYSLYPLNTGNPIVNIFNYDQPNRTTSYQITYTNDPRYFVSYNWDYDIEVVKNGPFLSATEKGKIVGLGNLSTQMFNNALIAYQTIQPGILARLSPLLLNYYQTVTMLTKHNYKGIVEYAQTYTENPLYSDSSVITVDINIDNKYTSPIYNRYDVFNYGVLSQPLLDNTTNTIQGQKLAEQTISIALQGRKTSNEASLKTVAQNYANSYIPTGNNAVFLTNCSYSFEPIEKKFNLTASWIYN